MKQRNYQCELCGNLFARKDTLRRYASLSLFSTPVDWLKTTSSQTLMTDGITADIPKTAARSGLRYAPRTRVERRHRNLATLAPAIRANSNISNNPLVILTIKRVCCDPASIRAQLQTRWHNSATSTGLERGQRHWRCPYRQHSHHRWPAGETLLPAMCTDGM